MGERQAAAGPGSAGAGGSPHPADPWLHPIGSALRAEPGYRTPLVASSRRGGELAWKYEGASLTGTFKDRVMAELVAKAVADGAPGAIVASSGNAAAAAAAACARAKLPLLALVPASTSAAKLAPLRARGVPVVGVTGDPSSAYAAADALSRTHGLAELASTFRSPGTELACRRIGHEIVEQLGRPPAAVAAAISVGPVLLGTARGVREASGHSPRMLAGQAAGCAPIAAAFRAGHDAVEPWGGPIETAAHSIADRLTGYAHEGAFMARQVRASGGTVQAWDDDALISARRDVVAGEGLDVELASAAGVCAAITWEGTGPVVGVLTGAGWRETVAEAETLRPTSVESFARRIDAPDLVEDLHQWTT